jgi:hypothetical protein
MIAKTKSKRKSKKAKDVKPEEPIMMLPSELEPLNEAADLLKRIEKQESECGKLATEMEIMRDAFKQLKGAYASATITLRSLCRTRREKMPLFDQHLAAKSVEVGPTVNDTPIENVPGTDNATKDAWRDLPLSAASINGSVGKLLEEAGHDTLGKVLKLMNDQGQWWNKEVKGIGEAGANEVADRFAAFWAEHPEFCR